MNTSAHPSPQADQLQPRLVPDPVASFTGVLLAHAEVRQRPLDAEGHMVPALCMVIELDSLLHNRLHAEQLFGHGEQVAAEFAARRYRKGTRVTVEAPIVGLRMVATNTTHIRVHQPEETAA